MKNLICLALVFLFIVAIVPKVQACVVEPVTTVTTVVLVGGGSGGVAIGFIYPILIELGVLAAFSPYFIIYYNHPECRQEKDIGSLSECYKKYESK